MSDSRYQSIDFNSLRWQRQTVVVGDGPDARTCKLLFMSRVTNCFPSWGIIRFANGSVFNCGDQTVGGVRAYIFRASGLKELWQRRELENQLRDYLSKSDLPDGCALVELIVEAAGASATLFPFFGRQYLVDRATTFMANVGVRDLQGLVELTGRNWTPPVAMANCA